MSSDRQASLHRRIAAAIDAHGDVAPPWAKYPEIPAGSLGWRMGYGEDWLDVWGAWLALQPTARAWRLAYLRRHPPAPRTWADSAIAVLAPDGDDDEEDDERDPELVAELEAAGVIGDDVAVRAWQALHGRSPPAPWSSPATTLAGSVRYGARELNFWARWCAARRLSGELDTWLAQAPEPSPAWRALRDAAASGAAPEPLPDDPRERLAVLLAAHGDAPAPWQLGHDPTSLRQEFDDRVSYADAWFAWVLEVFDDPATWTRYLDAHSPVPADWSATLARAIDWL